MNFVERAEDWRWSSASHFRHAGECRWVAIPDDPSVPRNWRAWVNKVETEAERTSLRGSVKCGLPFGDDNWTTSSAVRLGLETTTRSRGRPKKKTRPLFAPIDEKIGPGVIPARKKILIA